MAKIEPIQGRYIYLTVGGIEYRVYFEEAGNGIPLLLGHTAGSDGRQYRHLLNDQEVTCNFRCIVFDLPYHGKSLPPHGVQWWTHEYSIGKKFMIDFPNTLAEVLELKRPVYMGSSMGGHLAIDLALECPERYRATIAVEGALQSAIEYVDVGMANIRREFDNPNVNRASTGAAMLLNISPYSPRRMYARYNGNTAAAVRVFLPGTSTTIITSTRFRNRKHDQSIRANACCICSPANTIPIPLRRKLKRLRSRSGLQIYGDEAAGSFPSYRGLYEIPQLSLADPQ